MEDAQFRACVGEQQGFGKTPFEALEALMLSCPDGPTVPITIWPFNRSDAFFTMDQQTRLQELKARRETLMPAELLELEALVASAFEASVARAQSLQRVKA
ncbi:MAG: hypothetical protein NTX57_21115 [Armatimonadetes bacterium]|nr:hypothetical protein [Armatimonadota bacterium]